MEVSWNFCKTSMKLPRNFHRGWKFCGSFTKLPQNFHETSIVYGSFVELFQNFHETSTKLPLSENVLWKFYKTSTKLLRKFHGGIDFSWKTNTSLLNYDISRVIMRDQRHIIIIIIKIKGSNVSSHPSVVGWADNGRLHRRSPVP